VGSQSRTRRQSLASFPAEPCMTQDDSITTSTPPLADPPNQPFSSDPINEDSAMAVLQRADVPPELIEKLSKSSVATKSRKVKLAIVRHPKAPRYVSLSVIRHLFTFDLMQVALTPAIAGDLKIAAEQVLINRLETISAGEKLSLARRASGRVAAMLLSDAEPRIVAAALENPRLTEVLVTKALLLDEASQQLVRAVCAHSKWSLRREIRIALLRNAHTAAEHAIEFAKSLPDGLVREILQNSDLPEDLKTCLMQSAVV
jgi:hypothetical protein